MRNPWIIAQLAVAALLLVITLLGFFGTELFGNPPIGGSFAASIQTFAVFPGLVLSLVANALIMRTHRDIGVNTLQRVLLLVEGVLILALIVFHFYEDPAGTTLWLAVITWPILILLAIAIAIIAFVRTLNRPAPVAAPRPAPVTPEAPK